MLHCEVSRVQPATLITALTDFPHNQAGKRNDSGNTARQGQVFSILHFMYICHRIIVPSSVTAIYIRYGKYCLLVDVTDSLII
jgi:hypothetical protein